MSTADDLEQRLHRWVDAGIIDDAQAARIADLEAASTRTGVVRDGDGTTSPDDNRSLAAEIVGYLGAALATVALALIVSDYLDDLTEWAQIVLAALVAILPLGAGAVVRQRPSPAAQRLVAVLWAGGVIGVAFTAGLLAAGPLDLEEELAVLMWGLCATAVALPLHRIHPRMPQHLVLAGGVLFTGGGLMNLFDLPLDAVWVGLAVWGAGVAWVLVTATGLLPPPRTGTVLGLLGAGVGAQIATFDGGEVVGLTLGIATTVALTGLSIPQRSTLLLGFGVAGAFVFVPQVVIEVFGDSLGGPLTLLVCGLLLVVGAIGLNEVREQVTEEAT